MAAMKEVPNGQRPYGVWGDGSGPGDAGLSSIWYELSIGRVVASAELKKALNVHLSGDLGSSAQCGDLLVVVLLPCSLGFAAVCSIYWYSTGI